jgi:hypothetical protein
LYREHAFGGAGRGVDPCVRCAPRGWRASSVFIEPDPLGRRPELTARGRDFGRHGERPTLFSGADASVAPRLSHRRPSSSGRSPRTVPGLERAGHVHTPAWASPRRGNGRDVALVTDPGRPPVWGAQESCDGWTGPSTGAGGPHGPFGLPRVSGACSRQQHVTDAASLLTSKEALRRIAMCKECQWLFLDTTRNHSRRWCDPADCGNRARQRRHYRRHSPQRPRRGPKLQTRR